MSTNEFQAVVIVMLSLLFIVTLLDLLIGGRK